MNRMIASCGLICTECPAFLAHKNNDEELRIKTAKQWSKNFNADIRNINCVGCLKKNIPNCARC